MHRRTLVALAALATGFARRHRLPWRRRAKSAFAHVYSKTGPLEAYGKQTQTA